jgi:hypothetical protein
MSDFLYVVLPGVALPVEAADDLVEHVSRACVGDVPHNRLSRFRVNLTSAPDESHLEPLGSAAASILRAMIEWAERRASNVAIRLEGHRGSQPLPPLERRPGTLADVLEFKSDRRKPHHVEFVVSGHRTHQHR